MFGGIKGPKRAISAIKKQLVTAKPCFSNRALVYQDNFETPKCFRNGVLEASRLVLTKTQLLKHYYRCFFSPALTSPRSSVRKGCMPLSCSSSRSRSQSTQQRSPLIRLFRLSKVGSLVTYKSQKSRKHKWEPYPSHQTSQTKCRGKNWLNPDPPILAFFVFLAFFVLRFSLLLCAFLLSFPRISRALQGGESSLFSGDPRFFPKKAGIGGSGKLGARLRGRTATQRSEKVSQKVLGRVLGKGSQKGSEKGA